MIRACLKTQKGATTVVFGLFITVIAAVAALVVDIGYLALEKSRLSNAVDASALAGALALAEGSVNVEETATGYVADNIDNVDHIDVAVGSYSISVTASKRVNTFFARILGIDTQVLTSHATAIYGNISSISGARPFAVTDHDFECGMFYILKEGAGDGYHGNYGAIALGGTGASTYKYNIMYGYDGTLRIGDMIPTEPGVMAQGTYQGVKYLLDGCNHSPECTYDNYNRNCTRIIPVPIVDTMEVNGRKYVEIIGFATFFIEGVSKKGNVAEVTGRFISYASEGDIAQGTPSFGTYGVKLVE
jgi:hypothetical protein